MTIRALVASLVAGLAVGLVAMPAAAQFSKPFEMIKAVKDKKYTELRGLMLQCKCPNARTVDDVPVLVIAARNNDLQSARFLIESGANPSTAARDDGSTPLMEFAQRGNLEAVTMLIEAGADVDAGDNTGQTALIRAVRQRQIRTIEALLGAKADVEMPDYQGQTAIDVARNLRYRRVENLLLGKS